MIRLLQSLSGVWSEAKSAIAKGKCLKTSATPEPAPRFRGGTRVTSIVTGYNCVLAAALLSMVISTTMQDNSTLAFLDGKSMSRSKCNLLPYDNQQAAKALAYSEITGRATIRPVSPVLVLTPGDISDGDHEFINHVFSSTLPVIYAKQIMLTALGKGDNVSSAYLHFQTETQAAYDKVLQEPTPNGLEGFKSNLLSALKLELDFFHKARNKRESGSSVVESMSSSEGRVASLQLNLAARELFKRYPHCSLCTRQSIENRVRALDLFYYHNWCSIR